MRGERGARGAKGPPGSRGTRGLRGPAGKSLSRADILAMVEEQFAGIQKHLSEQLTRTAQVQAQLDRHHQELAKLQGQFQELQAALKQVLAST